MEVWTWSQPLGLGAFVLAITIAVALLSWTIKTLATIPPNQSNARKR